MTAPCMNSSSQSLRGARLYKHDTFWTLFPSIYRFVSFLSDWMMDSDWTSIGLDWNGFVSTGLIGFRFAIDDVWLAVWTLTICNPSCLDPRSADLPHSVVTTRSFQTVHKGSGRRSDSSPEASAACHYYKQLWS